MIWTAASAISASASWGRMRRMETILATSLSLLLSLFPPDASLVFISLKILYLTSSASPLSLTQNCFLCFLLNTLYLSASPFSLSLRSTRRSLSSAGWLIVTPQLRGWHMHQSLTNPTWSPETHSSTRNSPYFLLSLSVFLSSFSIALQAFDRQPHADGWKFDQSKQKIIMWYGAFCVELIRKVFSSHFHTWSASKFLLFSISVSSLLSLRLIRHFHTAVAGKGQLLSVDCIALFSWMASLQGHNSRSAWRKNDTDFKSSVKCLFTPVQLSSRNRTISFSSAYEVATTVLSMGTGRILKLFPARIQENKSWANKWVMFFGGHNI